MEAYEETGEVPAAQTDPALEEAREVLQRMCRAAGRSPFVLDGEERAAARELAQHLAAIRDVAGEDGRMLPDALDKLRAANERVDDLERELEAICGQADDQLALWDFVRCFDAWQFAGDPHGWAYQAMLEAREALGPVPPLAADEEPAPAPCFAAGM